MNGKQGYVDEKLAQVITNLETLSKTLLLDKINVNNQVEKYFSLEEHELNKMTASELSTGEYVLASYGLVIQRKVNRALAIRNWANKCLETIIAKNYDSFREMMKYEIRRAAMALNDDYARKLSDIIKDQDAVIDDLTYLAQSINNISNALANLARIRSRNNAFSNG